MQDAQFVSRSMAGWMDGNGLVNAMMNAVTNEWMNDRWIDRWMDLIVGYIHSFRGYFYSASSSALLTAQRRSRLQH